MVRTAILAVFFASAIAASAFAADWNGTWAGNWDNNGDGIQIIMAGNELTGFFFHNDYLDTGPAAVSKDAKVLTFTWAGGSATLTRSGDKTAHVLIREAGKPDLSFDVKRDD
jgi:hypothetical protein